MNCNLKFSFSQLSSIRSLSNLSRFRLIINSEHNVINNIKETINFIEEFPLSNHPLKSLFINFKIKHSLIFDKAYIQTFVTLLQLFAHLQVLKEVKFDVEIHAEKGGSFVREAFEYAFERIALIRNRASLSDKEKTDKANEVIDQFIRAVDKIKIA